MNENNHELSAKKCDDSTPLDVANVRQRTSGSEGIKKRRAIQTIQVIGHSLRTRWMGYRPPPVKAIAIRAALLKTARHTKIRKLIDGHRTGILTLEQPPITSPLNCEIHKNMRPEFLNDHVTHTPCFPSSLPNNIA